MARKKAHEEHANHEAWAIPYGDLVTLLLAFFVVMYAVSSVNEGKYRVLSEALSEAFGGPPRSIMPVQFGKMNQRGSAAETKKSMLEARTQDQSIGGTTRALQNPQVIAGKIKTQVPQHQVNPQGNTGYEKERAKLQQIADSVRKALGPLIDKKLITVNRTELWVEIEVRTDILFTSGSAALSGEALPILQQLADIVAPYPNRIRVEGHTDNIPISTYQFPSNWELSAARAASVLRVLVSRGVDPRRLAVLGVADQNPRADNRTADGRNANRRVTLVLLADPGAAGPSEQAAADIAADVPVPAVPLAGDEPPFAYVEPTGADAMVLDGPGPIAPFEDPE